MPPIPKRVANKPEVQPAEEAAEQVPEQEKAMVHEKAVLQDDGAEEKKKERKGKKEDPKQQKILSLFGNMKAAAPKEDTGSSSKAKDTADKDDEQVEHVKEASQKKELGEEEVAFVQKSKKSEEIEDTDEAIEVEKDGEEATEEGEKEEDDASTKKDKKKKARKPATTTRVAFPEDAMGMLAKSILHGSLEGLKKKDIAIHFQQQGDTFKEMEEKKILRQISKMAKTEKREGDCKQRLWLSDDMTAKYISEEDAAEFEAKRQEQIAAKEKKKTVATSSTAEGKKEPEKLKPLTADDDPRIETYSTYSEKCLEDATGLIGKAILQDGDISQDEAATASAEQAENPQDLAEQEVWARHIQGFQGPLDEIANMLLENEECKGFGLSIDDIKAKVPILAERKPYGVKAKSALANTDTTPTSLWRWEVVNLALLPKALQKRVEKNRRIMGKLRSRLNACHRLLTALKKNHEGKMEKRVGKEEETVQKLMREDELALQKAEAKKQQELEKLAEKQRKEEEKEEAKRKREEEKLNQPAKKKKGSKIAIAAATTKPLTAFFGKKQASSRSSNTNTTTNSPLRAKMNPGSVASPLVKTTPGGNGENVGGHDDSGSPQNAADSTAMVVEGLPVLDSQEDIQKAREEAIDVAWNEAYDNDAFSHLVSQWAEMRQKQYKLSKAKKEEQADVMIKAVPTSSSSLTPAVDPDEDAIAAGKCKKKLFEFGENFRPAYFGTFRKTSSKVNGRRPLGKDEAIFDYSYESDLDWQDEPDDAESLADSDLGSEKGVDSKEKELDYQDGWLMEDDLVEYESSVEGSDDEENEEGGNDAQGRPKQKRQKTFGEGIVTERYAVGIMYDCIKIERPINPNDKCTYLQKYKIMGLPNNADYSDVVLPITPSTVEEILSELKPWKKRKISSVASAEKSTQGGGTVGANGIQQGDAQQPANKKQATSVTPFPEELIQVFIKHVEGSSMPLGKLVDSFYTEQEKRYAMEYKGPQDQLKRPPTKKSIRNKLHEIAKKAKTKSTSKMHWLVNEDLLKVHNIPRWSPEQEHQQTTA